MSGRRKFLKNAGIGSAAVLLAPWNNPFGSENNQNIFSEEGLDLTDPVNAETLAKWGYLNVLAYGADPSGLKDSTAAIQAAIDAGYNNNRAVLFPLGTYIVKETLRCYKWWVQGKWPFSAHILIGENRNGKRPVIKLAASAPKFDDAENPRPMLADVFYQVKGKDWARTSAGVIPTDETMISSFNPMKGVDDWLMAPMNLFDDVLQGIDFDCSGHKGAVGVYFPSAQKCLLLDVHVNAEGAHTGIYGIPGRNSGATNISVYGGRFGLVIDPSEAGSTVVGLRLHNQTERALVCNDFVPTSIVGFEIKKKNSPVIAMKNIKGTAFGTLALVDGKIEVEDNGLIIDNKIGKSIYIRNVYAKGSKSFIASASEKAIAGSGIWYNVEEYCYNDQFKPTYTSPEVKSENQFSTFSIINGKKSQVTQPAVSVRNNVKPPADYVKGHLYTELPQISFHDISKTINVMDAPYNAVPDDRDNWEAFQKAIDDGDKSGKLVFIPVGNFKISKTLTLKSKTKLFGIGCKRNASLLLSTITAHPTWEKALGNEALIKTVDDVNAETFLGGMNLITTPNVMQHIHWRAGKKSTIMAIGFHGAVSESTVLFTGNGGGRHYLLEPQSPSQNKNHRHVRTIGTSQPLSWYGCNLECGKAVDANMELLDSRNIRVYGIKREGPSPTLIVNNCKNIGFYTQGAMREGIDDGSKGYIQIQGASDGILMALVLIQLNYRVQSNVPTLVEELDGKEKVSAIWPESVSLYKLGEIDDSKMYLNN